MSVKPSFERVNTGIYKNNPRKIVQSEVVQIVLSSEIVQNSSPGRSFKTEVQRRMKLFLKYSFLECPPLDNQTEPCAFVSAQTAGQKEAQCERVRLKEANSCNCRKHPLTLNQPFQLEAGARHVWRHSPPYIFIQEVISRDICILCLKLRRSILEQPK